MRPLSRRACLRGAGAALSLPWLEAMTAGAARAQAAERLRFLCFYTPNGYNMTQWKPRGAGAAWQLSPSLMALEPFRDHLNVISGLANHPASVGALFEGSHARGAGALLTQSPLAFTSGADIKNGISLDQVLANQLKGKTPLSSLELGFRAGSAGGNCEDGFSCAHLHNIAWSGPTTPMKKLTSPRQVFDRLFSGFTPPAPAMPGRTDNTVLYEKSLLDRVAIRATALQKRLGKSDRLKLDEYFSMVRSVEQRLTVADTPLTGGAPAGKCEKPATVTDAGLSYPQYVDLMSDLIVLAFQCDITRVITFMIEDALDTPAHFGFLGITPGHHSLSHHGGSATKLAQIAQIDAWQVARFAYLIGKLKTAMEGDRSVLDNAIVLLTSDFGDGDNHYHWDLPMVVAGKAGGRFKTNQHIVYPHTSGGGKETTAPGDTPMASLYLNILRAFAVDVPTFGSTGTGPYASRPLAELMV
jgi:hypothetical protein